MLLLKKKQNLLSGEKWSALSLVTLQISCQVWTPVLISRAPAPAWTQSFTVLLTCCLPWLSLHTVPQDHTLWPSSPGLLGWLLNNLWLSQSLSLCLSPCCPLPSFQRDNIMAIPRTSVVGRQHFSFYILSLQVLFSLRHQIVNFNMVLPYFSPPPNRNLSILGRLDCLSHQFLLHENVTLPSSIKIQMEIVWPDKPSWLLSVPGLEQILKNGDKRI